MHPSIKIIIIQVVVDIITPTGHIIKAVQAILCSKDDGQHSHIISFLNI